MADHIKVRECLDRPKIPEGLLALLALAVYARSLTLGFVYDDRTTVLGAAPALNWKNVAAFFTQALDSDHASNFYRPINDLWQTLVHWLAGTNALAWHLIGVLLHLACVLLVFRLACRLLESRSTAMIAAALFAIHPTHVEAVSWVSDSADSLMTLFLLLSALALLRRLEGGGPAWWVISGLAAALCCFVKESGVVVPVLLLALALSVRSRASTPAILNTVAPFCLISLGYLIVRSQVIHGFAHPLSSATDLQMLLTLPAALWFYISHLILPAKLGPFYPLAFVSDWKSPDFLLPVLILSAILATLVSLYLRFSKPRLFWFCALWTLVPLAPPLYLKLFPQFELVHDRYLYIPTIALGIAAAAALKHWAVYARGVPVKYATAAVLLLGAAAAVQTISYQGVWQNDLRFFQHALVITPCNARSMVNLGVAYLEKNRYRDGIAMLNQALQIEPENALAIFDLGNAAWHLGDAAAAETYLQQAVQLETHPNWWLLLARSRFKQGKLRETEWTVQQALELDPRLPEAHLLLGGVHLADGDSVAAVREISTELQLYPGNPAALEALQEAQQQLGNQRQ